MHTREMADHEGTFGDDKPSPHKCQRCGCAMTYRVWESSCGGYEDEKHACTGCLFYFWIDGPDS